MTTIACRARVSESCLEGEPASRQFGEDLPLSEDGTYDGRTIVCDPCYVELMPVTPSGQGLHAELDAAIHQVRAEQAAQAARGRVFKAHRFAPGNVAATAGVARDFGPVELTWLLSRHLRGDWGEIDPEDQRVNEQSLRVGARLMSVYTVRGKKMWVITEADRSVTTFLYPDEY